MPIAIIAILALLIGGGGTMAASQASLPGDALFSVKVATENVRGFVTFGDDNKKDFHIGLAEKRVSEINDLIKSEDADEDKKINGLASALGNMEDHLSVVEDNAKRLRGAGETVKSMMINNDLLLSAGVLNEALDKERAALRDVILRDQLDDAIDMIEDRRIRTLDEIHKLAENEKNAVQNAPNRSQAADGKITAASNKISEVERRLERVDDDARPATINEATKLLNDAKNLIVSAKADLNDDKFFDAFDKANQALKISSLANALLSAENELRGIDDNPNRVAENIRRQDRPENQGLKIEARVVANGADARVEARFITSSTERNAIAQDIFNKLRLNREQIANLLDIKNEINQNLQTRSEARADAKDGQTEVKVKIRFPLSATGANEIINGIVAKLSALTVADIAAALEIKNDNSGPGNAGDDNSGRRGGENRPEDDQNTVSPSPSGLDIRREDRQLNRQEDRRQDRQLEFGDDRLFPQFTASPSPSGLDIRGNADENELLGRVNEPGEDVRGNADENELRGRDNEPGEDVRGDADENEVRGGESGGSSGRR